MHTYVYTLSLVDKLSAILHHYVVIHKSLMSIAFGSQWNIADAPTKNIDVTLGSFIRLPCDPPPANPPPNVVWMQGDTVLDTGNTSNKYKVLAPEAGSGLIIARVDASDIGPVYRCRVTNALVFTTRDSPFSHQLRQIG